jgi:hypothetical protein
MFSFDIFEVPLPILDKRAKTLQTETAEPKKEKEKSDINLAAGKSKRTLEPFAKKYKQVRDTFEALTIVLDTAVSQSLAGKKIPVL